LSIRCKGRGGEEKCFGALGLSQTKAKEQGNQVNESYHKVVLKDCKEKA
jgi:hypothetical protein